MLNPRNILLALSVKYHGSWPNIYKAIKEKETVSELEIDSALALLGNRINFITVIDDNYPKQLKNGKFPPFVIFYTGNIDLLETVAEYGVGIFGNLIWDEHKNNKALTAESDITVLYSFLSDGVVSDAIKAKQTIYIASSFVDTKLPDVDLVISECLSGTHSDIDMVTGFAYRLLFALPSNILFVGCKKMKDIILGLGMLSNFDTTVYCLPTTKEKSTNNKLITEAHAFSIKDINGIVDPDNRSSDVVVDA